MTIDEAIIKHIQIADSYHKAMPNYDEAAEHRQIAEWLTELKQWRRVYGVCPSYEMCIPECKEGYNAQIAKYKRLLKAAINDIYKECSCNTYGCDICEYSRETCDYDDRFTWKLEKEAFDLIYKRGDKNDT